jgi:hypothetical protein
LSPGQLERAVRQLDRGVLRDPETLDMFLIALRAISNLKKPQTCVEVLQTGAAILAPELLGCVYILRVEIADLNSFLRRD